MYISPMKTISHIILLVFLFSCGSKTNPVVKENTDSINTDTSQQLVKVTVDKNEMLEDRLIDTIYSLPEVKERGNYIEKQTKGKNHLTITISERPDDNKEDFYMMEVGEDNGSSVVTHFNFFVYYPSLQIKYLDPVSGEEITLQEWRKQSK
jgi:hypothetical protein